MFFPPLSRSHRLGLSAVLLLAVGLRIDHFAGPSLWLDEYGTSWIAAAETWSGTVQRALARDTQSVLFSLMVRLSCEVFGNGPFALRLPSLIFGIASVAVAYPLAYALLRRRQAALCCTLVCAVNPQLIQVSQDARPYALAILCSLVSFRAFVALTERDALSTRAVYVVATAGAYYAHTLFGFIVVIQVVFLAASTRWQWIGSRRWWTSWLALAALVVPPTAGQLANLFSRRYELDWIGSQPWQFPFKIFVDFLSPKAFALAACWVLLAGLAPARRVQPSSRSRLLLAIWFLLPLVCFAWIPPLVGTRLIFPRYVLFALPAALLITASLLAMPPRGFRRVMATLIYLAAIFAFHLLPAHRATGTFSPKNEGGWDAAARYFEDQAGPSDLVLFASGFIEADRVASPQSEAEFRTYLDWPLVYHVSPQRREHVRSLPFRVTDATFPYVRKLLNEAAAQPRFWLVGDRFVVREISKPFLAPGSRLRLQQEKTFGKAAVMEFRQTE